MVNQAGSIVAKYTYDPWGKVLTIKDGSNVDVSSNPGHVANINPIRYAGYRYDTETGLYYLLARYYDPGSYRFLTKDPDGGDKDKPLTQNLYAYANGNPVSVVDPDGEWGYGAQLSSSTEAGMIDDVGQTGSLGIGNFGKKFPNKFGAFASYGAFANVAGGASSKPRSRKANQFFAKGAFAGVGANIFITNAKKAKNLKGRFRNYMFNVGFGLRGLTINYAVDRRGTKMLSVGLPTSGVGIGASVSSYDTDTRVR